MEKVLSWLRNALLIGILNVCGPISSAATNSLTGLVDSSYHPDLGDGFVSKMLALPDGKLIIHGNFTQVNGTARTNLARLNADGSLDASFNAGETGVPAFLIYSIVPAPNGRLMLTGPFTIFASVPANNVVRLNQDGSVDSTFNVRSAPISASGAPTTVFALAFQGDGKMIIGGAFSRLGRTPAQSVARLLSDGSVDATFDSSHAPAYAVYSVAIQPDGKILAGGLDHVFRLNADGSVDQTFANASRPDGGAHNLIALPDGRSLLAGFSSYSVNGTNSAVIRLNADGSLDSTFAPFEQGENFFLLRDQKERILLSGSSHDEYGYIVRLKPDGTRDLSFDFNTTPLVNRAYTAAIQSDGKILIAPDYREVDGIKVGAIVRLAETNATSMVYFAQTNFYPLQSISNLIITVTRSGNLERSASVSFSTHDGTATAGTQYSSASGVLEFAPGVRTRDITIPIIDNHLPGDPTTQFSVTLDEAGGDAVISAANVPATVIIREVDLVTAAQFDKTAYVFSENGRSANLVVRRTNVFNFNGDFLVDYKTEDGAAHAGIDYESRTGTLSFSGYLSPHGILDALLLEIPILNNPNRSDARSFRVVLSNPRIAPWSTSYYEPTRVSGAPGQNQSAEITIVDDALQINNALALSLPALSAQGYVVQSSSNLFEWTPIFTNGSYGVLNFKDPNAKGARGFYRALPWP